MIKRTANLRDPNSMASRLRRQRFNLFRSLLPPNPSILDLGGTVAYWRRYPLIPGAEITILNLQAKDVEDLPPGFRSVVGDACDLHQFDAGAFDVIHSNSTIEHLGSPARVAQFAAEVQRVGRSYWVQTPNRYFPIEPHWKQWPLFQFYPMSLRLWLLRRNPNAQAECARVRLLSANEMRQLFPGASLYRERVYGFTKSLVSYRF